MMCALPASSPADMMMLRACMYVRTVRLLCGTFVHGVRYKLLVLVLVSASVIPVFVSCGGTGCIGLVSGYYLAVAHCHIFGHSDTGMMMNFEIFEEL